MRSLLVRLIGENIELKFRLDPNLGLIKMDHTQAQQILLNPVLNARDAMPGGGQITVDTSNCQVQILTDPGSGASSPASLPCALFVVGDKGCGMDAATQVHLFEAFFTTKSGKGTGLGLATVHNIVTGNGGLIYVESAPARGTRVSVLLPLVHETAPDFHPQSETLPERKEGAVQDRCVAIVSNAVQIPLCEKKRVLAQVRKTSTAEPRETGRSYSESAGCVGKR